MRFYFISGPFHGGRDAAGPAGRTAGMGSVNASHWSDGRTSSRRVPLSSLVSKGARSVTQPLWRSRVIEPSRPGVAESVGGNHHRLPLWQSIQALVRLRQEHRALRRPTYGSLLDATCWPAMSVQEAVGRADHSVGTSRNLSLAWRLGIAQVPILSIRSRARCTAFTSSVRGRLQSRRREARPTC